MKPLVRSSHCTLNRRTAAKLEGDTLFFKLARAVGEAECLPRKEFFESWETARRARRDMRGGPVVELAAGHGLLSAMMLILDDTSPSATCYDVQKPKSHDRLMAVLFERWPRIKGRIEYRQERLETASAAQDAIVISVHACGTLTDRVLDLAEKARCRVAVLPCCHDLKVCDTGSLTGWMDGPLAVDAARVARLKASGFRVQTCSIPADITPKNRLLLAWPEG